MTTIPSEEDLVALAIECFRVAFDGFEDPIDLSADSFLAQFAKALVTSTYSQLVAVAGAERDAIPQNGSSFDALALWAYVLGLPDGTNPGQAPYGPLVAQPATGGLARPTGQAGATIADGTTLVDAATGSITFAIYGAGTLPVGSPPATINALTPGAAGNLAAGAQLRFNNPPAGVDPVVTLLSPLSGGAEAESAANPAPLLARILYRLQNPPGSGRASDFRTWAESAADLNGTPIPNVRAYVFELAEGLGTVVVTPTVPGSGDGRVPTLLQLQGMQAELDRRRPVCSRVFVRAPQPGLFVRRRISVIVRATPALDRYAWDFDDGGGLTVNDWLTGPTRLKITGAVPVALQDAIDRYKAGRAAAPRIQVASSAGPAVPGVVTAVNYSAPAPGTITVVAPAGFVPPGVNDLFFSASPFSTVAEVALLAYLDSLGPGRGAFADPRDPWDDTARISRVVEIVNATLDSDGTRMCNVRDPQNSGAQLRAGGPFLPADIRLQPGIPGFGGEIPLPGRVLVVQR